MKNEKMAVTFKTIGAVLIFLAVVVVVFILILTNGNETYTSERIENNSMDALICSTGGVEDAFFSSETVNQINNEVKITFGQDKISKVFYSYTGVYRSNEVAEEDETRLHAKYNIYMGENNVQQESLSPNYSTAKNDLKISLYVDDLNKINETTAVFFFIDKEEINDFKRSSMDELAAFYKEKGFSCKTHK